MGLFAWRKDYIEKSTARYRATKEHGSMNESLALNRKEPDFDEAPYKVEEEEKQPAAAPAASAEKKPRRTRKAKKEADPVVVTPGDLDLNQSEV